MRQGELKLPGLNGREYKIMLKPEKFAGRPKVAGSRFWTELEPVVADHMDKRPGAMPFDERFPDLIRRSVRFHDTDRCLLAAHDYSLRVRETDSEPEITLKLRTADILASGLTDFRGVSRSAKTKFEEDIAPLEVQTSGKGGVAKAAEPSMRSRFSRSTTQPLASQGEPTRLDQAIALFPGLGAHLALAEGAAIATGAKLKKGPEILEYVFRTHDVRLTGDLVVGFALTLWYFDLKRKPGVAEISFKWEAEKPPKKEPAWKEADQSEAAREETAPRRVGAGARAVPRDADAAFRLVEYRERQQDEARIAAAAIVSFARPNGEAVRARAAASRRFTVLC